MNWTLAHSLGMLLTVVVAWCLGDVRPIAAFGAASLAVLVSLRAGAWTPSGRFGPANAVTALRILLIVGLAALPRLGPAASLTVVVIFALDGVDGFLARYTANASSFGATFDMETDALLILVAGFRLSYAGTPGVWIVLPGLYRYLYGVALSFVPTSRGDAPRSRMGRYAFGLMVVALAASLWPFEPLQRPLAAVAVALLTASFVRSSWWSFLGPR